MHVEVVAVHRVDVVAQPDAGVGELDGRRRQPAREALGDPRRVLRRDVLLERQRRRDLAAPAPFQPAARRARGRGFRRGSRPRRRDRARRRSRASRARRRRAPRRAGPWRSSSVSPSSTRRSTPSRRAHSASSACGRASTSTPVRTPRCRSETTSVRIGAQAMSRGACAILGARGSRAPAPLRATARRAPAIDVSLGDRMLVEWVAQASVGDEFPDPFRWARNPLQSVILTLADLGVHGAPGAGHAVGRDRRAGERGRAGVAGRAPGGRRRGLALQAAAAVCVRPWPGWP